MIKNFFKKKIIFIVFRNNYRVNALGNFAKNQILKDFIIINLSGRVKSILGKILYNFNFGKFISIDGDPFLKKINNSINIWYSGTSLKITKKFRSFENNYVNIINKSIISKEKQFHIYPIIKKKKYFHKDRKIIFMGKFHFEPKNDHYFNQNKLIEIKNKIINDFSLIDTKEFWEKHMSNADLNEKFENYKIIKTFLRKEILKKINENFKNFFKIYGFSSNKYDFNFLNPTYKLEEIKKIYQGNICIDTGSILGSTTFSPRAIQIFESGGIMLQTSQLDNKEKLEYLYKDLTSNNIEEYLMMIENLIKNDSACIDIFKKIEKYSDLSKEKLNLTLKNIFR